MPTTPNTTNASAAQIIDAQTDAILEPIGPIEEIPMQGRTLAEMMAEEEAYPRLTLPPKAVFSDTRIRTV